MLLLALPGAAGALGLDGLALGERNGEIMASHRIEAERGPLTLARLGAEGPFLIEPTSALGRCMAQSSCAALDVSYDAWAYRDQLFGLPARVSLLLRNETLEQIAVELAVPASGALVEIQALLASLDTRYGARREAALLWNSTRMDDLERGYAWSAPQGGHVLLLSATAAPTSTAGAVLRLIFSAEEPQGLAPGDGRVAIDAARLQ